MSTTIRRTVSILTRRHALLTLAFLLAFSAVFTVSAPRAAQAAAKPITVALGFTDPCAPGAFNFKTFQCDCPSGYVFQLVPQTNSDPLLSCVLQSTTGQGVTDVAGTINRPMMLQGTCPLFADAALKNPAMSGGKQATLNSGSVWPEKPTIAPNVDLVSVAGQPLYTDASCFHDVRTIVISADSKTLTIEKGGDVWKTLSAPTGETITSAVFGSSGLAVTFNIPAGTKPDTTALLAAAKTAANAANAGTTAANTAAAKAADAAKAAADAADAANADADAKAAADAAADAADAATKAADAAKAKAGNAQASTFYAEAAYDAYIAATAANAAATAANAFVTAWKDGFTPTVTYSIDQINAWSSA